jgi:peptide/nickel transport system permease protein
MRSRRSVARAVGLYALTLAAVVVLVFALPRAMPGDPLAALVNAAEAPGADAGTRTELQRYYGLDRPLVVQLGRFLANASQGDLGFSISRRAPVGELIRAHLPWTLLLVGTSLGLATALTFVAGVTAGWRRGSGSDRLLVVTTSALRAIPTFALASLLLLGLAVLWPVFPLSGARTPFAHYGSPLAQVGDVARHLALPVATLTMSLVASNFLLVRNATVSVLGADYLVMARAKGVPEHLVKYRHAGRNALLPFFTVVGLQVGFAIGGAIFVESVFAYPGMGTLILSAVASRDYPVLDGTFLVLAVVVLTSNLAVELLYRRVDPRTQPS